jgi:hypothetical protein
MIGIERAAAEEADAAPAKQSDSYCARCGVSGDSALKRCSACKTAGFNTFYCGEMCQRSDYRWHRQTCGVSKDTRARLRRFGRLACAVPGAVAACEKELQCSLAVRTAAAAAGDDGGGVDDALHAPLQVDPVSLRPEVGGAARLPLWRRQLALLRASTLYAASVDELFSLPTYARFWSILSMNAITVAPRSLFLDYFFSIVNAARAADKPLAIVGTLKPLTDQLQVHQRRVESSVGAGLFMDASVINHACVGNVEFQYNALSARVGETGHMRTFLFASPRVSRRRDCKV